MTAYQAMTEHLYVFTWAGRDGPTIRRFSSAHAFDAYVREWRLLNGINSVTWLHPLVAQGAL